MPMISVRRLREADDVDLGLLQEIKMLQDRISRRAYDLPKPAALRMGVL